MICANLNCPNSYLVIAKATTFSFQGSSDQEPIVIRIPLCGTCFEQFHSGLMEVGVIKETARG